MSKGSAGPKLSRRQFLAGAGALSCGAATWTYTVESTADFEVTGTTIASPAVPAEFDGYRIAFLSDLHCGPCFPVEWLDRALGLAAASNVSLLALGGDYLWIADSPWARAMPVIREPKFAGLPLYRLMKEIFEAVASVVGDYTFEDGVCAVFGNHDQWEAPELCQNIFERAGIAFLRNSSYRVQRSGSGLSIYGVEDYWTGLPRLPMEPLAQSEFRILLAHNPDYIAEVQERSRKDFHLGLSGHTHGGQIRLPFLGALVTNIRHQRLLAGLDTLGRFPVYTTRGIGVVEIPYRLNCRPEITVLELRRSEIERA